MNTKNPQVEWCFNPSPLGNKLAVVFLIIESLIQPSWLSQVGFTPKAPKSAQEAQKDITV